MKPSIIYRGGIFCSNCGLSLGGMALGSFLSGCSSNSHSTAMAAEAAGLAIDPVNPFSPRMPHFAPKAKSVIYLHMAGAPSQLELFDYKPELTKMDGQSCPPSFLEGKKFAFIRGVPKMLGQQAQFSQHGQSGAWVSDYLPHLQTIVDDVCFLKGVQTDQFNHAPAQLLMQTGSARLGSSLNGCLGNVWFRF